MPGIEIALQSVSVVVRGFFNPSIFSPDWLLRHGIIGAPEFEHQTVQLISQELSQFQTGWLTCTITTDALQFQTQEVEEFERLRDAVDTTLRLLSHTPVAVLGINRDAHCVAQSIEQWHRIGDILAPKDEWSDLRLPGLRSLSLWAQRDDHYSGRVQVSVEPSFRIPQSIYVQHNDHYTLGHVDEIPEQRADFDWMSGQQEVISPSADKIEVVRALLLDDWAASMKRADDTIGRLAVLGAS